MAHHTPYYLRFRYKERSDSEILVHSFNYFTKEEAENCLKLAREKYIVIPWTFEDFRPCNISTIYISDLLLKNKINFGDTIQFYVWARGFSGIATYKINNIDEYIKKNWIIKKYRYKWDTDEIYDEMFDKGYDLGSFEDSKSLYKNDILQPQEVFNEFVKKGYITIDYENWDWDDKIKCQIDLPNYLSHITTFKSDISFVLERI